ncbi:uncharacterized protein LOC108824500 [Raphanus sativus]|uniref:Uncharacterized protein LOC108824500 n=1 Tax=Raphanus sativus TaxID=3726 RepID=A0A6J0L0T4_RAPSA|nr:uncharacterized protein LOC108824500 [Raphanus sativus]
MEKNQKKGHNKKGFHLKKHKKADPRATNKGVNDEKPVLFQLGSIAMVSDSRLKADPEITNSIPASPTSSSSSSSLGNNNAKDRKLSELQSSSNTLGSQVSGVTHASSVEPALLSSPSVQLMDREGSDLLPQRKSLPVLERNLSAVSNDSLFSLSIGDNTISRDELFSYRDFKAGELLKSGELLAFCPSVNVTVDSSDVGKSFDLEDKATELLGSDSDDDKSSNSEVSWRNLGDNSDEAPSSTQSVSSPITKKSKKKKKVKKKKTTQHQHKQKKRCSWLCCKDTGPCFSCCKWPSCNDDDLSCCKRLKYCLCCCGLPQCCFSSCSRFFCCCCSSSSKKLINDEMAMQKPQKAESKTSHKWFCCFPSCCSS